jgi:hypothetical protein
MKRIIKITTITVLIVLTVLTFVSRTVYNRSLPRVSRVTISAGYMPITIVNETAVSVPGAWQVKSVPTIGGEVNEDDILFTFDTRSHDFEIRELEIKIDRLKAGDDPFAGPSIDLANDRLAFLDETAPPPLGLHAPAEGIVTQLFTAPGRHTIPGQTLLVIRNETVERGDIFSHIVPMDAIFQSPARETLIYVINNRPGLFGTEDFITFVGVNIIARTERFAAIRAENEDINLDGLIIARDVDGWIGNGDVVWVRER